MPAKRSISERFWSKVHPIRLPDDCWLWIAHCSPAGYGMMSVPGGHPAYAHRVSWEIVNGPIPDGLFVLHRCDNPSCVNPHHLFLGSHSDNMRDMRAKGRGNEDYRRYGERHHHAKLTEEKVREIRSLRAAGVRSVVIAETFGIDPATVRTIVARRAWRHVA